MTRESGSGVCGWLQLRALREAAAWTLLALGNRLPAPARARQRASSPFTIRLPPGRVMASHSVLHDFILEVMYHQFCHILLARDRSCRGRECGDHLGGWHSWRICYMLVTVPVFVLAENFPRIILLNALSILQSRCNYHHPILHVRQLRLRNV